MIRRPAALIPAALVLALSGCWTQEDAGSAATAPPQPEAAATAPAAAPEPACPAGSPEDQSYDCLEVTVTGAAGAEPGIELSERFGPADALAVADVYEGSGDPVAPGATLTVNYVGVGEQSREVFDSSWPRGQAAQFPLDGVIQGWQEGMLGMRPGGRRLLVIPGSLGYGPAGYPPDIAPDETLVFVVDLVEQVPAA